ncbi:MAG: acyl-CoA dehydrogenase family protein [Dehalococcoidia bacterium]|nr:acyl-CoA dehydrogenase family protein [Dehalococcoidia bacterium]
MVTEAVPEEARDLTKGAIEGLLGFIDSEVVPLEEKYKDILHDERKLFGEDGLLVPPIREARDGIRVKSAQAGYYSMFAPSSVGGGGMPWVASPLVLEAIYRKYGPGRVFIGWAAGFLTSPLLASFVDGPSHLFLGASQAIRDEVLPPLLAGEKTVCFGVTEPGAGSDLWGLKTKARRDGDEWVVSGSKQWITNAPYCDYAAVFAITNEEAFAAHKGGLSCFLLDATAPGFTKDRPERIMGHISSDCGGFTMDDVRVRNDYMIGAVDGAFQIAMFGISEGRMGMASSCLGLAEWALDRSLEYAAERKTFGVSLADHQALQFMMADMALDIFATKYMIIQTANMLDAGKVPVKEICMSKAYAIEMCQRAYDRAIQIHGGMGLSSELALEEGFRIARTARIPDGTSEIQRRTIFRQLQRGDTTF